MLQSGEQEERQVVSYLHEQCDTIYLIYIKYHLDDIQLNISYSSWGGECGRWRSHPAVTFIFCIYLYVAFQFSHISSYVLP